MHRDYAGQPPAAPAGYKYDQYHGGAPVNAANQPTAPLANSQLRDGNGDVPMHDAQDAHAGIKYPMRPHHQSHLSADRTATLHSPQEPSAAAQRYSPMEALSPASPYAPKSAQFPNQQPSRQSPTKQGDYPSSPYYPSRPHTQQLPPISPYGPNHDGYPSSAVSVLDGAAFANDPTSPRRHMPPMPVAKGPVPEFRKVRAATDLHPKNSAQPPFRRANPEGGFISVREPIPTSLLL